MKLIIIIPVHNKEGALSGTARDPELQIGLLGRIVDDIIN